MPTFTAPWSADMEIDSGDNIRHYQPDVTWITKCVLKICYSRRIQLKTLYSQYVTTLIIISIEIQLKTFYLLFVIHIYIFFKISQNFLSFLSVVDCYLLLRVIKMTNATCVKNDFKQFSSSNLYSTALWQTNNNRFWAPWSQLRMPLGIILGCWC